MHIVNALGQPCPIPVVKAKKALESLPPEGGSIQVLVDNAAACENLGKMARQHGCTHTVQERGDGSYEVLITMSASDAGSSAGAEESDQKDFSAAAAPREGTVVAIGRDVMGGGSDELGRILIKGFIFSLAQLDVPPKAVLFFNAGVRLTTAGANTLDDLKDLQRKGVLIRVCGTCVDYYGCREQTAVGEITNMYGIVEMMNGAQTVINL